MTLTSTQRKARARIATERELAVARLSEHGLVLGQQIKVAGEGSRVFTVFGMGADGSVTVTDNDGAGFRSFRPEWCYNATRVNRRRRTVPANCPPAAKAARDTWRAAHGF